MLVLRHIVRSTLMALAAAGALAVVPPAPAAAQGKLDARYTVTLAGIPIGKGDWIIEIADTRYRAAATGTTTGLMHVLTEGEGTSVSHGTLSAGKVVSAIYDSNIKSRKKIDDVRMTFNAGNVKEFKLDPPEGEDRERVPVTEADRHGVFDPMGASLVTVPGTGNLISAEACRHSVPIFDGRMRYDLDMAFKRIETVKADKGYAGPVVVCAVYFKPISGHVPSRTTMQYLSKARDMEIWLAPIAGTRVMVAFRAQGPTPIGLAVMEATQFVTVATPTKASANSPKSR